MARKPLSSKRLESYLQNLDDFDSPKMHLEQYATPPHIAALLLNTIDQTYDDLSGKIVADLGCGTGRLTVGSLLCDAKMVMGFDIDFDALQSNLNNINNFFEEVDANMNGDRSDAYRRCDRFNLIHIDVAASDCDSFWVKWHKFFDTVIMNPPFGTKQNCGLDMKFLQRAIALCKGTVYSLHKSSTRNFIQGRCQEWCVKGGPIAQIRYNLDNTYKFHKHRSVDIAVDLWRINCSI